MKKTVLSALFTLCNLLKASDFQLELPVYDPFTNITSSFRVDIDKKDSFTQLTFRDLMQRSWDQEALGYRITVFRCLGLSGISELAVADTHAFNHWIMRNGKVDPITRKLIISNCKQDFIIMAPKEGKCRIFQAYCALTPAVVAAGNKRKREEKLGNDDVERIFKEIQAEKEARRAREQKFLRDND